MRSSTTWGQRPPAATATLFNGRHFSFDRPMHSAGRSTRRPLSLPADVLGEGFDPLP